MKPQTTLIWRAGFFGRRSNQISYLALVKRLESTQFFILALSWVARFYKYYTSTRVSSSINAWTNCLNITNKESARGGGGRCLQGNLWYSPPASMTSRLASVTFKMASKVFIKEKDKNFDFITEILFWFLGFGDFKVSMVIEN